MTYFYLPPGADISTKTTGNCVTIDADGKILIGGELSVGGVWQLAVLRLNSDLSPDPTFGAGGWWLYPPPNTNATEIQGITVQPDGKILVAGGVSLISGADLVTVSRINPDGTSDTTFAGGTGTLVFLPSAATIALGFGLATQSDGSIIVCGSARRASDSTVQMFTSRVTAAGAVDTSYGTSGSIILQVSNDGNGAAWGMYVDSSDRAVLGGLANDLFTTNATGTNAAGQNVLNVTSTASPLPMVPGMLLTIGTGGSQEELFVVSVVSGTQITTFPDLAFAHSSSDLISYVFQRQVVARVTTAGAFDSTFNTTGYNSQTFGGLGNQGLAIAEDPNGLPVVCGGAELDISGTGIEAITVSRYTTAGALDTTFNGTGWSYVPHAAVNGIAIDQQGRYVFADNGSEATCSRMLPSGIVDAAFAVNGTFPYRTPAVVAMTPNGVAITPGGNIILAGVGTPPAGQSWAVLELDDTGQVFQTPAPGPFIGTPTPPGRNPFRYLHYDLVTRTYLGELPYQGVNFGVPQLNQPGPFNGNLPIADPRVQNLNWQAATSTGRTAVIVDLAGVIVWGGILWTHNYQKSDPAKLLKVSGQSFGSYLQHRLQAADYSTTWSLGADPMVVSQQIITDAMALGSIMGGITVALHPAGGEGGPQITPSYPGTALQTVDSIISLLSQMGYGFGFDYSFDVAYVAGVPAVTLNIWYPRQGRTLDQTQLVIQGRNVIDYTYPVDATQQALSITESGSGTGGIQPVVATASVPGYPLLERTLSRTQVNDEGTLGNIAAGDLGLYAWPVITPTVTVPMALPDTSGQLDPRQLGLGQFYLGDDVRWLIDVSENDPRFPRGMDYEWRITGWTATVGDQPGQLSKLDLNLTVPPVEGVPIPPPF